MMTGCRRCRTLAFMMTWVCACCAATPVGDPSLPPPPSALASTASEPSPASPDVVTTRLELIPRAAWGALPVRGRLVTHTVARLTVHHSAQFAPDVAGAPGRIRGFQRFHQSRGFPDIAYHYIVDRAGNVYEGRSDGTVGSSFTKYDPAGHFLALLDGNFEQQDPTSEQVEALAGLLAWASTTYHIPTDTISGHRDHAATACPGRRLYTMVHDGTLRARVDAIVARGPVELVRLSDAEGSTRVARIASSARK